MDASELRQIVEMFIQESDETLAQFEQCFLELEKSGPDSRVIDRLCRMSRNLRGSAAALGFTEISNFTSHLETFLSTLKDEKLVISSEIVSLLLASRDFLANGIQTLRSGKKSTETGETIVDAMANLRRSKPEFQPINLPRPAEAGDIWFVGNDLKAVLFEMPEQPLPDAIDEAHSNQSTPNANPVSEGAGNSITGFASIDPKLAAIQAEILRLTMLAAQVNLNTVQAATALETAASTTALIIPQQQEKSDEDLKSSDDKTTAVPTEPLNSSEEIEASIAHAETAEEHNTATIFEVSTVASPEKLETSDETVPENEAGQAPMEDHTVIVPEMETLLPGVLLGGLGTSVDQVKIGLDRIDRLVNYVGELVILQSAIEEHRKDIEHVQLQRSFSQLAKVVHEVQEIALGLRMVKVKPIQLKLQRIVRDHAQELNKPVDFSFIGEEVEMDKTVLDLVAEPIFNLVRYSLKFGIENTETRSRSGKPVQGKLEMSIKQQSRGVVIEIRDDGRGIDFEAVRRSAVERGLVTPFEKISEEKLSALIFHPGFSQRNSLANGSEPMFDMSKIASLTESLNGKIQLESKLGHGSCFRLVLPNTISIVDGVVVKSGRERFVVAKTQVSETIRPHEKEIALVHGKSELISLHGKNIPLFHLSKLLGKSVHLNPERSTFDGIALVVENDEKKTFAVIVDDVVNQQQVVIKKLGNELQHIQGLVGATILGDGRPAIVVDLEELVNSLPARQQEASKSGAKTKAA